MAGQRATRTLSAVTAKVRRVGGASWANPIEAHFGPLRQFTTANSHHPDHPNHTVQPPALHAYLRWRNANARHRDVLAAERWERARIRSEKGIAGAAALSPPQPERPSEPVRSQHQKPSRVGVIPSRSPSSWAPTPYVSRIRTPWGPTSKTPWSV